MTYEEVDKLIELDDKFQDRCSEICNILKEANPDMKSMDTFVIGNTHVSCSGDEYWSYGGHEHFTGTFPVKYLYMSNEEIQTIVNEEVRQKEEAEEQKRKRIEAEEIAKYQELKAKYEGRSRFMYEFEY
jgi:hypothetical protein